MELEVQEALRTLTQGNSRLTPHEALSLQDRLRAVDEKFSLLRREISRLNAIVGEEKDKNGVLTAKITMLEAQVSDLKKKPAPKTAAKKTTKKKTTKKK